MTFIKKGVVIPLGSPGEADDSGIFNPSIIRVNDKFYCYYTGYDGSYYRIMLAVSEDGVNFIKKGVVIPLGGAGEADDLLVYLPSVMQINDKFYCYYDGHDGSNARIILAVSEDGVNFIKKGVVIPLGGAGEVDDVNT